METIDFIKLISIWAIPSVYAITMHEAAHGYVAKILGDKSAYMVGRTSINPFRHVDILGTFLVPILTLLVSGNIFGWAKPMPINEYAVKYGKKGLILVFISGPLANLIMAIFWAFILKLSLFLKLNGINQYFILTLVANAGIKVNIIIGILNLIPIPPLDGGKIVSLLLPKRIAFFYNKLESIGFIILLGLLISGVLIMIIGPIMGLVNNVIVQNII